MAIDWLFVCPPNSWEWDFLEIIGFGGSGRWSPCGGFGAPIRGWRLQSSVSPKCEDIAERHRSANQEEDSHQKLFTWHFAMNFRACRTMISKCLWFKLLLYNSVIAVGTKTKVLSILFKKLIYRHLKVLGGCWNTIYLSNCLLFIIM